MLEELFNGRFVHDDSKKNKIAIALVYYDDYRNEGQGSYYKTKDLENHLTSIGYDLNNIAIIPMENERILGVDNTFAQIYHSDDK